MPTPGKQANVPGILSRQPWFPWCALCVLLCTHNSAIMDDREEKKQAHWISFGYGASAFGRPGGAHGGRRSLWVTHEGEPHGLHLAACLDRFPLNQPAVFPGEFLHCRVDAAALHLAEVAPVGRASIDASKSSTVVRQRQDRCGQVLTATTAATSLAHGFARFLKQPRLGKTIAKPT